MQRSALNGVKASATAATADTPPPVRRTIEETEVTTPDTPIPDYEEGSSVAYQRRKSLTFVNNFQNVIANIRTIEDLYSCFPEPDPDYTNDEEEDNSDPDASEFPPPPVLTAEELSAAVAEAYDMHVNNGVSMTSDEASASTDAQLIKPKPLPNPCIESKERKALHRELLMNYKIGKDVLKKPELNKVLRDRREKERTKEWDEQKTSKGRTSLVMKLEERANRLKEEEEKNTKVVSEEAQAPELTRVHRKITHKTTNSSEQT